MKKLILFFVSIVLVVMFEACAKSNENKDPKSNPSDNAKTNQIVSTVDTKESKENQIEETKFAPLIPKPEDIFSEGIVSIIDSDGGMQYFFRVTNYKDGEYETYIAKCKEMGFSDVHSELETSGGKMFLAYTEDNSYYLQVYLGYETNAIDVICKKVTE